MKTSREIIDDMRAQMTEAVELARLEGEIIGMERAYLLRPVDDLFKEIIAKKNKLTEKVTR
jgi:hypothetical protein